jgi:hypothetical protein
MSRFILPIKDPTITNDFRIYWGDGTSDSYPGNVSEVFHDYTNTGPYTATLISNNPTLTSGFTNFYYTDASYLWDSKKAITDVIKWGNLYRSTFNNNFYVCGLTSLEVTGLSAKYATDFSNAWNSCVSLKTFPRIIADKGTDFTAAWQSIVNMTTFEGLTAPNATNFRWAWASNTSLSSFPSIDFPKALYFGDRIDGDYGSWMNCINLKSMNAIIAPSAIDFSAAWTSCYSLTGINIHAPNALYFANTWGNCSKLSAVNFGPGTFSKMTNGSNCFLGCTLPAQTWTNLLTAVADTNSVSNVNFHGGYSIPTDLGKRARAYTRSRRLWTITDGEDESSYFEILIIAGGGGARNGPNDITGGAGAGGLILQKYPLTTNATYNVVVGNGGVQSVGQDSTITQVGYSSLITAKGGGTTGGDGGSGGGGDYSVSAGTRGIDYNNWYQGHGGGNAGGTPGRGGGGGGGASKMGADQSYFNGGSGGNGLYLSDWATATTTGVNGWYGGGGGGGSAITSGVGGLGGGGNGGLVGSGSNGVANTGGGGGGAYNGTGGNGGSGLVIIRYPGPIFKISGGTITYDFATKYIYHTFKTSGSFTVSNNTSLIVQDVKQTRNGLRVDTFNNSLTADYSIYFSNSSQKEILGSSYITNSACFLKSYFYPSADPEVVSYTNFNPIPVRGQVYNIPQLSSKNTFTILLDGYFYAPTTGTYKFKMGSDDNSFLWFNKTESQKISTNADISNPSTHPVLYNENSFSLTAGTYYPITIMADNTTLNFAFDLQIWTPSMVNYTRDGSGYFYAYKPKSLGTTYTASSITLFGGGIVQAPDYILNYTTIKNIESYVWGTLSNARSTWYSMGEYGLMFSGFDSGGKNQLSVTASNGKQYILFYSINGNQWIFRRENILYSKYVAVASINKDIIPSVGNNVVFADCTTSTFNLHRGLGYTCPMSQLLYDDEYYHSPDNIIRFGYNNP